MDYAQDISAFLLLKSRCCLGFRQCIGPSGTSKKKILAILDIIYVSSKPQGSRPLSRPFLKLLITHKHIPLLNRGKKQFVSISGQLQRKVTRCC